MNTENKYLSRTFWISIYIITASFALDWFKDKDTFVVVITALITGWFGMKLAERIKGKPVDSQ